MKEKTVEEMNMAIAEYMGWGTTFSCAFVPSEQRGYPFELHCYYFDEDFDLPAMRFASSFGWLMPVWQKLRGELLDTFSMVMMQRIQYAIITCDITTAHRLIYEAIQLIKTK